MEDTITGTAVEQDAAAAVQTATEPQPDPVQAAPAKSSQAVEIEEAIETWFHDHFHNSIVSRDTDVINHVRQAVDSLKRTLSQE